MGVPHTPRWLRSVSLALLLVFAITPLSVCAETETAVFFQGLNLNGPTVTIDGNLWEGQDSVNYVCKDKAFEAPGVPLLPATDAERARMLRSSRWNGNRVELTNIPAGMFTVFLNVWEDNRSGSYEIRIDGKTVLPRFHSGTTRQ